MNIDQTNFTQALLDPSKDVPTGLVDPQGRPAGKRFDVYRNNVVFSLIEAMEVGFPAIQKLVGKNNFRVMAGEFVRKHPPQMPILMLYGADFPAFIENFPPVANFPYMPDVARLEQAQRVSYHAADATAIAPEALAKIPPEQLMSARFTLAPATHIVASQHPVVMIWQFNTEDNAAKPEAIAQTALVYRPEFDPQIMAISAASGIFIEKLMAGGTLSDAFEQAAGADPEFDLGATLGLMLQTNIITTINLQGGK